MPTSPNISEPKWYDPAWAALLFFTRLPLWRLHQPPTEAYRRVTEWWPLVGWLTAAVTAVVLYGGSQVFPYP
ncbi:MAG: adenosylcobinamide-GDP ribazoletransferase, partial [Bacteroidaceae bacterium]|nr:adenosylcobinamide-GDP ribazoletransferase [Bacteroidaceae bacterium]